MAKEASPQEINKLLTGDENDNRGIMYYNTVISPIDSVPTKKLEIASQPLMQFLAYNKYYKKYIGNDPNGINDEFIDFISTVKDKFLDFSGAVKVTDLAVIAKLLKAAGVDYNVNPDAEKWFPDFGGKQVSASFKSKKSFDVDPIKFLDDLKRGSLSVDDGHSYFDFTQAMNDAASKAKIPSPDVMNVNEAEMIAKCIINGDVKSCNDHLKTIATDGITDAKIQEAVNKISPKALLGALTTLGFKSKSYNGMTYIQDYDEWIRKVGKFGIDAETISKLQSRNDPLARLVRQMVVRARSEILTEKPTVPSVQIVAKPESAFGLTGFYPMSAYAVSHKYKTPVEELRTAQKTIRDLQTVAGMHKLRNMDGYFLQFGGEPDYQSGGGGESIYTKLFETLYKQVKAKTGRDIDDKTKEIINSAIENLGKYDNELRRFLKDLGMFSVVSNMFADTPQGTITQGMLHAAIAKYKSCIAKYAARQSNILGVADQLCNGAI